MQTSGVDVTANDADIEDSALQALELARIAGAQDAKVGVARTEARAVTVRDGAPAERSFHLASEISITVFRDGKRASTSTSDRSREGLQAAITAALHIASVATRDEAAGLADAEQLASDFVDLDLFHPAEVTLDEMVEFARRAESAAYATDKAIARTNGASVHTRSGVSVLATSRGFMARVPWSLHAISASAVAAGKDEQQIAFWSDEARAYESLSSPQEIGRAAATRALGALNSAPVRTQTCSVLFEPMVAMSFLREFVASASGSALYRTGSFLTDRLGTMLFPEDISVVEDPFVMRGIASRCFDGDGIAVSRRNVIDRGALTGYFLDLYAARRLKMKPTGSGYGAHNLEIRSERSLVTDDLKSMLSKLGRGLLVTDLVGGGVNRLNGDFSRAARGFWIEGGEIQCAVSGVTLASNLLSMFGGVRAIGSDRLTRWGMTTGSWLIDEMKIGGL